MVPFEVRKMVENMRNLKAMWAPNPYFAQFYQGGLEEAAPKIWWPYLIGPLRTIHLWVEKSASVNFLTEKEQKSCFLSVIS